MCKAVLRVSIIGGNGIFYKKTRWFRTQTFMDLARPVPDCVCPWPACLVFVGFMFLFGNAWGTIPSIRENTWDACGTCLTLLLSCVLVVFIVFRPENQDSELEWSELSDLPQYRIFWVYNQFHLAGKLFGGGCFDDSEEKISEASQQEKVSWV